MTNKSKYAKILIQALTHINDINIKEILLEFESDDDSDSEENALQTIFSDIYLIKNWEFSFKEKRGNLFELLFDYTPLDDQLRLYVYLKEDEQTITEVTLSAE